MGRRFTHIDKGGNYELISHAKMKLEVGGKWADVLIYQDRDGGSYVTSIERFNARFIEVCSHEEAITFQSAEQDGDDIIAHVNCTRCGSSGSLLITHKDILWSEDP